jgi:hypothetical protein
MSNNTHSDYVDCEACEGTGRRYRLMPTYHTVTSLVDVTTREVRGIDELVDVGECLVCGGSGFLPKE